MARFKKKRSKPTPDPKIPDKSHEAMKEDVAKDTPKVAGDIPEVAKEPDKVPTPPSMSEEAKSEKDRKLNRLFWMRVALAVIAGTAATFIFEDIEGEDRRWASIAFMIIIFLGTIFVAKNMNLQLPPSDRKKIVTQAIGSYIFLYLFTWIMSYTLVHSGSVSSGVNI